MSDPDSAGFVLLISGQIADAKVRGARVQLPLMKYTANNLFGQFASTLPLHCHYLGSMECPACMSLIIWG